MALSWSGKAHAELVPATQRETVTFAPPASGIQSVVLRERAEDSEEFVELYRAHFAYVWKTARRLGVTPDEVDDIVQETFLTAHRLHASYEAQGAERAWLFSILFRIVQHHRRAHRRRPAVTDEALNVDALPAPSTGGPDRNAETRERVRMLESILDQLDPEKRAVLVLAELEEKPLQEIADILGINVNTAASRLRLAREQVEAAVARHRARDGWRYR